MANPLVFLDTSIFISALLSSRGGSFYLLHSLQELVIFQTNEYALEEIKEVLREKFPHRPDLMTRHFLLLGTAQVSVLPNPLKKEVVKLKKYISEKDAPILASALANSDYLLTLDNEFFGSKVATFAKRAGLNILKPGPFIQILRQETV